MTFVPRQARPSRSAVARTRIVRARRPTRSEIPCPENWPARQNQSRRADPTRSRALATKELEEGKLSLAKAPSECRREAALESAHTRRAGEPKGTEESTVPHKASPRQTLQVPAEPWSSTVARLAPAERRRRRKRSPSTERKKCAQNSPVGGRPESTPSKRKAATSPPLARSAAAKRKSANGRLPPASLSFY